MHDLTKAISREPGLYRGNSGAIVSGTIRTA